MNTTAYFLIGVALLSVALLLFYLSLRKKNRAYTTEVKVYSTETLIDMPARPTLVMHFTEGLGNITDEKFHDLIVELDKVVKENIVEAVETGKIEYTWENDVPDFSNEPEQFNVPMEESIIILKDFPSADLDIE